VDVRADGNRPDNRPAEVRADGSQPDNRPVDVRADGNRPDNRPVDVRADGNRPDNRPADVRADGSRPDNRRVDLHVHTRYSDGDLTPERLVREALENDVAAVAVTDHDTVMGVEPVLRAAEGTGLEILPGVELSARVDSAEVHVLGFLIDVNHPSLVEWLELFRQKRRERALEMVDRLRSLGLSVQPDLVLRLAGDGSVGRPHVAGALLEQGLIQSFDEAFYKYIGYNGPAHVPKYRLDPGEAFDLIRSAGGVAAVAHPGTLARDHLLPGFVPRGMEALEVWHPRHNDSRTEQYRRFALEHRLAMVGGSDSHGGRTGLANFSRVEATYASVRALKEIVRSRTRDR